MRKAHKTFAGWCTTPHPYDLGLEHSYVSQICKRMQSGPEMRGIDSWSALARNLKTGRSYLFWDNDQTWERFMLTARCMWVAFKESRP